MLASDAERDSVIEQHSHDRNTGGCQAIDVPPYIQLNHTFSRYRINHDSGSFRVHLDTAARSLRLGFP
jgi:hypothetical protein